MPQGKLILDVAILAAVAAVFALAFNAAITARFIPWVLSVSLFGVVAFVAWDLLWSMPVRYSLEGGVVRLCSPIRCIEYEVEGVEGEVYNSRIRREWFLCSGFHGFRLMWVKCSDDHIYFATAQCRDVWKKLQVRKGDKRYTLWLCTSGRG